MFRSVIEIEKQSAEMERLLGKNMVNPGEATSAEHYPPHPDPLTSYYGPDVASLDLPRQEPCKANMCVTGGDEPYPVDATGASILSSQLGTDMPIISMDQMPPDTLGLRGAIDVSELFEQKRGIR